MNEKEIFVYIDLNKIQHLVGTLWVRLRNRKQTASFEYSKNWLESKHRFALEPALFLGEGAYHTEKAVFGSIGDSAPDRWGRVLMRRANNENRTLFESDYLLLVDDETRQGALRFKTSFEGGFLTKYDSKKIPPLIELHKLLSASEKVTKDSQTDKELKLLFAPGSSLGGARPKASVKDSKGALYIAKFPHYLDEVDIVRWEAVALTLAEKAGIKVSKWRLEKINKKTVLLLKRFDREGKKRIPFLSAMSMLNAKDNETRSYLEIVDSLRQYGAEPQKDMHELFRRIVFSVLISNTDDHLRNHGFLYQSDKGWSLSPAYDLNPVPIDLSPRILSTNISENDGSASLELACEVAHYFELSKDEANKIVKKVKKAVLNWKNVAKELKISSSAIKRMESAFDYKD